MPHRTLRVAVAAIGMMLTACGSNGSAGTPVASPSAAPSATAAFAALPVCHNYGDPCALQAGTFVTPGFDSGGDSGFFPGLQVTLPAGWTSAEEDAGEFKLSTADFPDDVLLMWRDVRAVQSSKGAKPIGTVLESVDGTAAAFRDWFTSNPDIAVLDGPTPTTLASGLQGATITMQASSTVNFGDPECPSNPRCVAFVTDVAHWPEGDFYAIGGDEVVRMFFTNVTYDSGNHTLFLALDAKSPADLEAFAAVAQPIIESVVPPTTFVSN